MTKPPASRVMRIVAPTLRPPGSRRGADRRLTANQIEDLIFPHRSVEDSDTIFGAHQSMAGRPTAHTNTGRGPSPRPPSPGDSPVARLWHPPADVLGTPANRR